MTVIRSFLFAVVFYLSVPVAGTLYLPLLLLPRRAGMPFFRAWLAFAVHGARLICGIRWRLRFAEGQDFPDRPVIYAAKHQSAWETLAFNLILPDPVFVLKKELKALPFFGWYLGRMGQIAVDRAGGAAAMRGMVAQALDSVAAGRSVVIYPQGTRVSPGAQAPYHPGVFALYRALDIPVVPVALDSGRLWRRNGFLKHSGTITVSVLPEIPPGLDRKAFMAQLETAIETETERLYEAESGG
jgi:1-acyl-sn-glycerol-3-phosphate acyltransferase